MKIYNSGSEAIKSDIRFTFYVPILLLQKEQRAKKRYWDQIKLM